MEKVDCSYYVYLYLKPDGTPFYVGKGKDDRWKYHLNEAMKVNTTDRNNLKLNTIRKILKLGQEPIVKFVDSNIPEEQAFELEEFLISEIGRIDLGTGTLTNLTNGGEGQSGYVYSEERRKELSIRFSGENNPNYGKTGELCSWWGKKHSDETKQRISEAQKGKVITEEHKAAMRKPKSEEGRKAIAEARLNSTYRPSEETKLKVSEALKGRPSPMKGRKQSEEAKRKMSEQRKGVPSKKKGKPSTISEEDRQKLSELIKERNEQIVTCPYCGKVGKFAGMIRWHMENCKKKESSNVTGE